MNCLINRLKEALDFGEIGKAYILNDYEFVWNVNIGVWGRWQLYSHGTLTSQYSYNDNIRTICGNDDKIIMCFDHEVRIINRSTNQCTKTLDVRYCVENVYFSPDNNYLYYVALSSLPHNQNRYSLYALNQLFIFEPIFIKRCKKTCTDNPYADSRILLFNLLK